MEIGINNLKDILEIIVWFVGAGALVFAAYTYHLSKKQLNFAVIVSCTERFQKIMPKLKSKDKNERQEAIQQYIDLCNEELFYFKYGYLPEEIVNEWMDGMLYYLPHFDGENDLNKDEDFLIKITDNLLHDYPRIKESFTVSTEFNLSDPEERKKLIKFIKENLKNTNSYK